MSITQQLHTTLVYIPIWTIKDDDIPNLRFVSTDVYIPIWTIKDAAEV